MALEFQKLKYVDDRTDKLVPGYLNELNTSIDRKYIIPSLVVKSCLLFYFVGEYFEHIIPYHINRKLVTLSNNNCSAKLIDGGFGALFGHICIDSMSKQIFKWSVKLGDNKDSQKIAKNLKIGIADSDLRKVTFYGKYRYAYCCNGRGTKFEFGKDNTYYAMGGVRVWTDGDCIDVILDTKRRIVAFYNKTEDEKCEKAFITFENIKIAHGLSYNFAVEVGTNGQSITFLN